MARLTGAYDCDECHTQKKNEEVWYLGIGAETTFVIMVYKWDEGMALHPTIKHLCGVECSQKFVGRQLQRLSEAA